MGAAPRTPRPGGAPAMSRGPASVAILLLFKFLILKIILYISMIKKRETLGGASLTLATAVHSRDTS